MSEKWTPEQFWEFMKGYTGEFEAGQIRDMLDDSGLILAVAPTPIMPPAKQRLDVVANEMVATAFCANWHGPDGLDHGARELARIKAIFVDSLTRFACAEIRLHMERDPQRTAMTASAEPVALAGPIDFGPNWKTLERMIDGDAAPPSDAAREAWQELAATWIEDKAEMLTNSLHCGDSSMQIHFTHKHAGTLRELAKEIRASAPPRNERQTEAG